MTAAADQARKTVVDRLVELCPVLTREHLDCVVRQAVRSTASLRGLDVHLTEHPDALTSGSSNAPPALVRFAALLSAAGVDGIVRPRCLRCGRARPLPTIVDGGRVCNTCHRREMIETCVRCRRSARMAARAADGPVCLSCYRRDPANQHRCSRCGRVRVVFRRLADGSGLCEACAPRRQRICDRCGQPGIPPSLAGGEVVCRRCYRRPERECGVCGQQGPIKSGGAATGPPLCARCYRTSVTVCSECFSVGPCDHDPEPGSPVDAGVGRRRISQPLRCCDACGCHRHAEARWPRGWICRTCYIRLLDTPGPCLACGARLPLIGRRDGVPVCGPCVGDGRTYRCPVCGHPGHPVARGLHCRRCEIRRRLTAVLANEHGVLAEHLHPLVDALVTIERPRTMWNWLFVNAGGAASLVAELAAHPGPLSHEILDALPAGHRRNFLRRRLIEAGVLPPRDFTLELLASWVDQRLAQAPGNTRGSCDHSPPGSSCVAHGSEPTSGRSARPPLAGHVCGSTSPSRSWLGSTSRVSLSTASTSAPSIGG